MEIPSLRIYLHYLHEQLFKDKKVGYLVEMETELKQNVVLKVVETKQSTANSLKKEKVKKFKVIIRPRNAKVEKAKAKAKTEDEETEEATKSCSTCKREPQPLSSFVNVATGKETKTCINCRNIKRKCNDNTGCVQKNDKRLANHLKAVKASSTICYDCAEDFEDPSEVYIYCSDDSGGCFNRIRSIKAREDALDEEQYVPICLECRRDRLKKKRDLNRKKAEEELAKQLVVFDAHGNVLPQKKKTKKKTKKPKQK